MPGSRCALRQAPTRAHQPRIKQGPEQHRLIYYHDAPCDAQAPSGVRVPRGESGGSDSGTAGVRGPRCRYREEASGRRSVRAHLEAVDGEEAAEDALLEPRAQDDHVVLLVHGGFSGGSGSPGAKAAMRRRDEGVLESS